MSNTTAYLRAALTEANRAINSMKVEAETAVAGGDEQMLQEACETISNEWLAASMAIDAALALAAPAPTQAGEYPELPPLQVRYDGLGHTTTMGYGVSQMRDYADATCAARGAAQAAPEGWVPCVITYEGQHPEEVAYGPKIMIERLKKWLDRYFELRAQAAPVDADTGRLNWLEQHSDGFYNLDRISAIVGTGFFTGPFTRQQKDKHARLREAIDAARAQEQQP